MSSMIAAPRLNRVRLAVLLLILLLAWGLRTHDLQVRSLWADEGWTMLLSAGPRLGTIARTLAADQHPPLFFILFRLWRNVAGDTEFAVRYFGVLAGVLTIAGSYRLGRALFTPKAGVLAALILALADLPIDLAQEARHYGLLALWVVFCAYFYVRWWRHPAFANRFGFVLTAIALIYTHYLGAILLVAEFAHLLIVVRPWRRLRDGVFLFGAVGAAFLPWLPVMIDQNRLRWTNPLYYQNSLPNNLDTYRAVRTALLGHYYAIFGVLMVLGLLWVTYRHTGQEWRAQARLRPTGPAVFLLLWAGLMIGPTVIVNQQRQFLTVRNFILVTPVIAVLVGHGLANLQRAARWFMVALVLIVGLTTVDARRSYPDWRAVTRNVTDNHLPGEPVLMDVWVGDFPVRYYIDRQMGADTPRVSLREWRDQYKAQFLPTLLAYLNKFDAFWLIYWGDAPMSEYGDLIADAGFQRTAALVVEHLGTPLYSYRYDRLSESVIGSFGDVFALRKVAAPETAAPGERLRVALWWTAEQTPALDYSVSVFVLAADGSLVAQHDGPPQGGAAPTSTWRPGELKYDEHRLTLPDNLPPGRYQLRVKVYWYGDRVPLPVTTTVLAEGDYLVVGTLDVR